ncbi:MULTISPECIES: type II toxin-antitoxin system death-on-curing family toxin [Photorhabdus]|uniref:Death-on-curing protein n=2 Tax=Photorhabdus asymbiotica TaxID=291112 RepID=B6VMW9_PHOAA|nr:type II toxin-antitoxin system death-on-curing family toxin [Photorhabdus asymbiotica]RKS54069.1 death-on-curing protein [Photorhabdus asymbiotica]CAQ85159.1 death-on-curing protein [Photorhabdus asymbiotica]CAR67499.1 death-on-curing protein [Photorhabdus asymbiotica subsp. asymbiotica ATCC 43949]
MIFHVSLDEICYIREELVDRYGGLHGVVDTGRVDAVLYRIQALCEYEALTDLFEIASYYLVAIARGHVFADGNKRTALTAALFFLKKNGVIVQRAPELVELTVLAATGDDVRANIAKCFFQNRINNRRL